MARKIPQSEVFNAARNILEVFVTEGVIDNSSLSDLCSRSLSRPVNVGGDLDSVTFSLKRSNLGTKALTVSYAVHHSGGIPIEVIVNPLLGYFQVFVKCNEFIPGYTQFLPHQQLDPNNITQSKAVLTSADYHLWRAELEFLSKLS
ncbi:MAG: hypothetical protein AABW73_00190 [Nanoarchaeota archaeon]